MATITTRAGKGSPLTNTEVDNNFTNLNTAKYESGNNVSFGTVASGATTITSGTAVGLTINHNTFAKALVIHRNDTTNSPAIEWKNNNGRVGILYAHQGDKELIWRPGTTTNNYELWHTGNDGSGSGLDADTVDGKQASNLIWDNGTTRIGNMNTLGAQSAKYSWNNATTGRPASDQSNEYGTLLHLDYDGARAHEQAWDIDQGNLYLRTLEYSSDSGSWSKVWHSGNDGSGSGLDADTLDGVHGGSFLRSDATDSASGAITFSGDCNFSSTGLKFSSHYYSNLWNSEHVFQHIYPSGGNGTTNTQWNLRTWDGSAETARVLTANGNGTFKWGSNTIWHAGNDGSGSGLDADTVDGIQASSFLRSDTTDVMAMSAGTNEMLKFQNNSSGGHIQLGFQQQDTDGLHHRLYIKTYKGSATASGNVDIIVRGSAGSTTSDVLALHSGNSAKWRTNTIWDSGNDGSGSGLDADTLDGSHASSFEPASNTIVHKHSSISTHNWNDYINGDNASYRSVIGASGSNKPPNYNYGVAVNFSIDTQAKFQLYASHTGSVGNGLRYRTGWNTDYKSWAEIWDSNNDGSGSGLDADTVDGVHGSSFLRSDADDTKTGKFEQTSGTFITSGFSTSDLNSAWTVAGTSKNVGIAPFRYQDSASNKPQSGDNAHWGLNIYAHAGSSGNYPYGHQISAASSGNIWQRWVSNGAFGSWKKFWDSGNDGSGSGLDADLLDGQQGSYYAPSSHNHNYITATNDNVGDTRLQYINTANNTTLNPSNDWYTAIRMGHGNPTTYYANTLAVKMTGSNVGEIYTRTLSNGTNQSWRRQWDSNNDGSGSGLDADTVDGIHGSSFARTDSDYTTDTNKQARFRIERGGYAGSLSSGNLQAYTTGANSAFMSFHRSGAYAVNMGLDADNKLRIGGWSASANRWVLDMSGNMTAAGNVTAYSDERLKENIETIPNALEKVSQIRGVTFTRNDQEDKETRHTGVIAQEVEKVLPEVISEDNLGIKNVAYGNMVGLLIEAIKELKAEIEELKGGK